ncbi:MAG: hypothetical protein KF865_06035 [Bdellovibrionaceae bacterium]|nr:hypothetical protein [Pseudobdellovibrionaceae bacterium]
MSQHLTLLLTSLLFALSTVPAQAAEVTQVKNGRAMLDLSGDMESTQEGDTVFATDADGKRKAILTVQKVRGTKAIAVVTKGTAEVGYGLAPRGGKKTMSRAVRADDSQDGDESARGDSYYKSLRKTSGKAYGIMGGFQQTAMAVTFKTGATTTSTANLKGSSFGVTGFYDHPLASRFFFRGIVGYEQLSASASCVKGNETTCSFTASALSFYGQAKYNYMESNSMRGWLGAGFGFLYFMGKSSNVIDTAQLSSNQIYQLATGLEFPLRGKAFIPVTLEYGMYPASDTVKNASAMVLRAGYAWNF